MIVDRAIRSVSVVQGLLLLCVYRDHIRRRAVLISRLVIHAIAIAIGISIHITAIANRLLL